MADFEGNHNMARLNDPLESDEELPELSAVLQSQPDATIRTLTKTPKQEHGKTPSQRQETQKLASETLLTERRAVAPKTVTIVSSDKPQSRKQRPLGHPKQAHFSSLLLPMSDASISNPNSKSHQSIETAGSVSSRASPRRLAKVTVDYSKLAQISGDSSIPISDDDDNDDNESSTDLSGFIVPDSASDEEILVSKSPKKRSRTQKNVPTANSQEPGFLPFRRSQYHRRQPSGEVDLVSPVKNDGSRTCPESSPSTEPFGSELVEAHPNLDEHLIL